MLPWILPSVGVTSPLDDAELLTSMHVVSPDGPAKNYEWYHYETEFQSIVSKQKHQQV